MVAIGTSFEAETLDSIRAQETSLAVQRGILTQQVVYTTRNAPTLSPSPVATVTPSPTSVPFTPSPTPTAEIGQRSPEDFALTLGPPHDADAFDGEGGVFLPSNDGASRALLSDGRYVIEFDSRGRWTWYWSFIDAGDFYSDILVIQSTTCVEDDAAGLLFRGSAVRDEAYLFGVNCAGEYFIGLTSSPGADGSICSTGYDGSVDCRYQRWQSDDIIHSGPGAVNRLGVYAVGDHLDFYVNGVWLESRDVDALSPEWRFWRGNIALFLRSAQVNRASVEFDDFNMWYFE